MHFEHLHIVNFALQQTDENVLKLKKAFHVPCAS
jgi:hypothetical protein